MADAAHGGDGSSYSSSGHLDSRIAGHSLVALGHAPCAATLSAGLGGVRARYVDGILASAGEVPCEGIAGAKTQVGTPGASQPVYSPSETDEACTAVAALRVMYEPRVDASVAYTLQD